MVLEKLQTRQFEKRSKKKRGEEQSLCIQHRHSGLEQKKTCSKAVPKSKARWWIFYIANGLPPPSRWRNLCSTEQHSRAVCSAAECADIQHNKWSPHWAEQLLNLVFEQAKARWSQACGAFTCVRTSGNMRKTLSTAVCHQQQHFQPVSQSHARCVIQWLPSEGVLWSTRPPALHNSVFIRCNINVDRGLTANTGKDTYRHDQLKWVLVHPHRWLIFLHHGGDYSNTDDLHRDKDNTKWLEKERGIIRGVCDREWGQLRCGTALFLVLVSSQ